MGKTRLLASKILYSKKKVQFTTKARRSGDASLWAEPGCSLCRSGCSRECQWRDGGGDVSGGGGAASALLRVRVL
jgi:hypothetical protein